MTSNDTGLLDLVELLTAGTEHLRTPPPTEVVQAIERLSLDLKQGYAEHAFDAETGETNWTVTVTTDTVLIQATASARRTTDHFRSGEQNPTDWSAVHQNERGPRVYVDVPTVLVTVRRLANLRRLDVNATGATDSFELAEQVKETWTFTFSDGDGPLVFEIAPMDSRRPIALDHLCQHLAAHL